MTYTFLAADHISNGCASFPFGERATASQDIRDKPSSVFKYFLTTVERQAAIAAERELLEFEAAQADHFYYHKQAIDEALESDFVRDSVKASLIDIRHSKSRLREFQHRPFMARLAISGEVLNPLVFYRKISGGEWGAIESDADPFTEVFKYQTGSLYRYWMSSSLAKVRAFGNENASDASEYIIRIKFTRDPWTVFTLAAHQATGVQSDVSVVAVHREGFAEIGNIDSPEAMSEIGGRSPRLDHNLGFTLEQLSGLKGILDSFALHR